MEEIRPAYLARLHERLGGPTSEALFLPDQPEAGAATASVGALRVDIAQPPVGPTIGEARCRSSSPSKRSSGRPRTFPPMAGGGDQRVRLPQPGERPVRRSPRPADPPAALRTVRRPQGRLPRNRLSQQAADPQQRDAETRSSSWRSGSTGCRTGTAAPATTPSRPCGPRSARSSPASRSTGRISTRARLRDQPEDRAAGGGDGQAPGIPPGSRRCSTSSATSFCSNSRSTWTTRGARAEPVRRPLPAGDEPRDGQGGRGHRLLPVRSAPVAGGGGGSRRRP